MSTRTDLVTVTKLPSGHILIDQGWRIDLRDQPMGQLLGFASDGFCGSWAVGIWTKESRAVGSKEIAEKVLREYAEELAEKAAAELLDQVAGAVQS